MASDRKLQEGLEHVRQAEKCMKTGFLKWKPDIDGAVFEYGKAAIAFKNAKAYDQAISSHLKCADVQRQAGSHFHAAKSLESAAMLYKECKQYDKIPGLMQQAVEHFLEHGAPDTAVHSLEKTAKMIEQDKPNAAIQMYLKACDISEGEDNQRQCGEMVGKAARVMLRIKKWDEAVGALKREMDYYSQVDNQGVVNKLVLGVVMLQLHRQDWVAADAEFRAAMNSYSGFATSEEAGPINQLIEAYDQGDQDAADEVLRSPLFKFMENEFTKLARDLRVPGGRKTTSSATAPSVDPHGQPPTSQDAEEDEYAGGLL